MSFDDLPDNWSDLPLDTRGVPLVGAFLATPAVVRSFPAAFEATADVAS